MNSLTTKQIINSHAVLSKILIKTDAAGKYQTYHYDLRGSTVALTDEQGQVTDTYSYDTYGERLSYEGASPQPFPYNGRGRRADGC